MALSTRDIIYNLLLNPGGWNSGAKSAAASGKVIDDRIKEIESNARKMSRAFNVASYATGAFSVAAIAALYQVIRAAMEWETAWAGVTKTIEASQEQYDILEEQFRDLAKSMPASHQEIAKVAEAAGQLGIRKQNLAEFTRTMIDMGVSTNLAAEDAAMAFGRIINIMGTSQRDVRKLGSTMVDLGNKFAATESEISTMSLRIAGAGKTIGLTEANVLSFATALSSVGIYAEMGGSAISRVFIKIDEAVQMGGESLTKVASVAQVSAGVFANAYSKDPAQAIAMFVKGLGTMQARGDNVFATLKKLGLSEIRVRDTLLRLASAGDLLGQTLEAGNQAWNENNALTEEAEKRYGTTAAQVQIAMNRINDLAIDLGANLLPAVASVGGTIGEMASMFQSWPGWLKTSIVVVGALTAAVTALGTAALIAVPKWVAFKTAVEGMTSTGGQRMQRMLTGITGMLTGPLGWGLAAAAAAVTVLGVVMANNAAKAAEFDAEVKELASTLSETTGSVTHDTRLWLVNQLATEKVFESAEKLGISKKTLTDAIMGEADALAEVNAKLAENLEKQGQAGSAENPEFGKERSEEYTAIADALEGYGGKIRGAKEKQKELNDALGEGSGQTGALSAQQNILMNTFGLTAEEASKAAGEVDKLGEALNALWDAEFGMEEAQDAVAKAFLELQKSVEENGKSLTGNGEAALANRDAVRALEKSYFDLILEHGELTGSAEEVEAKAASMKQAFLDQLRQLGLNEEAIQEYAEAFDLIPREVTTYLNLIPGARMQTPGIPDMPESLGFSDGGPVRGPGGPRDDLIRARLSNGEFVMPADKTAMWWEQLNDMHQGRAPRLRVDAPGSAGGGEVVNNYYQTFVIRPSTSQWSYDDTVREARFAQAR